MVQDLPTNITNGRLSGNVKYIEHDDGTWSFRLTIYVSEEPPILIESNGHFASKDGAKEQVLYALDTEAKKRRNELSMAMGHGRSS
jgi:hypothetical protein